MQSPSGFWYFALLHVLQANKAGIKQIVCEKQLHRHTKCQVLSLTPASLPNPPLSSPAGEGMPAKPAGVRQNNMGILFLRLA